MQERVRAYVEKYQMILPGDRIVAGISGGPDSVCLLYLLKELCREKGANLLAVHVNHGIRGAEAEADEVFVQKLCEKEGIPLRVYGFDVPGRAARERLTLEEAGRLCRYEAFKKEAEGSGRARIAVAHHANDQAETVLFHLFRGSGIRGLAGMEPVRDQVIRPLLCLEREEILVWLRERNIPWRTDSTNGEVEYTRNRIRHGILREAEEQVNAHAARHVAEAAAELSEIEAYLEERTAGAYRLCVREEDEGCFLFETPFRQTESLIQGRVLRRCMGFLGGLKDVERIHIRILAELMEKQCGSRADLPGGRGAVREYSGIRLYRQKKASESAGSGVERCIRPEIPGTCLADGKRWTFSLEPAEKDQIIPQKTYTKWFDYDKIKKCPEIRGRRPGDYLEINREHGRKKLKAYLTDEKIPAADRDKMWFLADGEHILWVPGRRISEGYKVTETTVNMLKVQIDGGEEDG